MQQRVRVNGIYIYDPAPFDRITPPDGVQKGILNIGDKVKVVNLPGCPKANTMGCCYIQTMHGKFAGMVYTGSLTPQ